MKTIREIDIKEKRVLIRVDFNLPMDGQGNITDDTRIKSVLQTIEFARDKNARVILASHMGRPGGKRVPGLSLAPAARRLGELLGQPVSFLDDCLGETVMARVLNMSPGEILLLENLRFHPGETENSDAFGKELALLCEVYINDAFAVSHRKNASVCAIATHAPVSGSGFLLERELDCHKKAFQRPRRPFVALVGGAKISGKIEAVKNLLEIVDVMIIGGAMANVFLKQKGYDLGTSMVDDNCLEMAESVMEIAKNRGVDLFVPVDVVVAEKLAPDSLGKNVLANEIPSGWMALDIGWKTSQIYAKALDDAGTIVWNGPMGAFECEPFSRGTMDMARSVAASKAFTIVGGGDTNAAVKRAGVAEEISYISTGGGAFLALLEGKTLPGIAALG